MSVQQRKMWQKIIVIAFILIIWGAFSFMSNALPIDPTVSDSGSSTPFSTRSGMIDTPWDMFDFPLTISNPTSYADTDYAKMNNLAEPGMGNVNKMTLGHLIHLGDLGDSETSTWVLYDRLVKVYVPHLLYYHPGGLLKAEPLIDPELPRMIRTLAVGDASVSGGGGSGGRASFELLPPPDDSPPDFVPVPEPSAMCILGLAGLLMLTRQNHKRHV